MEIDEFLLSRLSLFFYIMLLNMRLKLNPSTIFISMQIKFGAWHFWWNMTIHWFRRFSFFGTATVVFNRCLLISQSKDWRFFYSFEWIWIRRNFLTIFCLNRCLNCCVSDVHTKMYDFLRLNRSNQREIRFYLFLIILWNKRNLLFSVTFDVDRMKNISVNLFPL